MIGIVILLKFLGVLSKLVLIVFLAKSVLQNSHSHRKIILMFDF